MPVPFRRVKVWSKMSKTIVSCLIACLDASIPTYLRKMHSRGSGFAYLLIRAAGSVNNEVPHALRIGPSFGSY